MSSNLLYSDLRHVMCREVRQMNSTTEIQVETAEIECGNFATIGITAQEVEVTASYEALVLKTLDRVFASLGEKCSQLVYHHVESRFGIQKADIPFHIEGFELSLEDLFEKSASIIIIAIVRDLHRNVPDFEYREQGCEFSFITYMKKLRHFLS